MSCRATSGLVAVGKREEKRNIIPTHSGGTMFRLFLILRDRIDCGSAWRDYSEFCIGISVIMHPRAARDRILHGRTSHDVALWKFVI